MEFKDYYQTLGVGRDSSLDEIKKAYRKQARKYHPDVSEEPEAEAKFKEINEAYEVLKDQEKRAAYDQFGSQWKSGQGFRPPPNWDAGFEFRDGGNASGFSDFFEALFGGVSRGRQSGPRTRARGEDHHAKIVIDLDESFHGGTRAIKLQSPELTADGRMITRARTINVKIPPGIAEGQRIRLTGQVTPSANGAAGGDLYLEVAFRPHSVFRVEGKDVYLDLPITPWEAALGQTVTAPTLGGKVELKMRAGAQSGQKLRLKGRGLPGSPAGDQYVVLKIVTPEADSEASRAFYEKMATEMPMNPRAKLGV